MQMTDTDRIELWIRLHTREGVSIGVLPLVISNRIKLGRKAVVRCTVTLVFVSVVLLLFHVCVHKWFGVLVLLRKSTSTLLF